MSSRVPKAVAPVDRHPSSVSVIIGPQMSRWPNGMPAVKSSRNRPAVIVPAFTPPMFLMSAIFESSWRR